MNSLYKKGAKLGGKPKNVCDYDPKIRGSKYQFNHTKLTKHFPTITRKFAYC